MKEIIITDINCISHPTSVHLLQTTPYAIFIANGIITHNKNTCIGIGNPDPTCVRQVYNTTATWNNGDTSGGITTQVSQSWNGGGWTLTGTVGVGISSLDGPSIAYPNTIQFAMNHVKNGNISDPATTSATFSPPDEYCHSDGCLLPDTMIRLADHTEREVQYLAAGDILASVNIVGMSLNYEEGLKFQSSDLRYTPATTTIQTYQELYKPEYIDFNHGLLQTSTEHINLVSRGGVWQFLRSHELQVGDILTQYE